MPDILVVLIVVLIVVLVWRGPRTLPEIGRVFGRGVRAARDEARDIKKGDKDSADR
jgi:Sec-independent protein translocase protein TatA